MPNSMSKFYSQNQERHLCSCSQSINTSVLQISWSPSTHQLHSRRATRGRHHTTAGSTSIIKRSSASKILAACMRCPTHAWNEGQTRVCLAASVSYPMWTHFLKLIMAMTQRHMCMHLSSVYIVRFDMGTLSLVCLQTRHLEVHDAKFTMVEGLLWFKVEVLFLRRGKCEPERLRKHFSKRGWQEWSMGCNIKSMCFSNAVETGALLECS